MSKLQKFIKNGYIKINVESKPVSNTVVCLENDKWCEFRIDSIKELNDGTFELFSNTILSIR